MDDRPIWERELDGLVRPSLVVDPPPDIQQSILAAVLQATVLPGSSAAPARVAAAAGPVPLLAYVLLAAVLVAYVAAVSWLNGYVGGGAWVSPLVTQLVAVSEMVVGRPTLSDPLSFAWQFLQRTPWLALLPLAWLLWERDRSAARVA